MTIIDQLKQVLPSVIDHAELKQETTGSNEYKGKCPKCGGTNRFTAFSDTKKFKCIDNSRSGCGWHGDVIDYHEFIENTDRNGLIKKYSAQLDFSSPTLPVKKEKFPEKPRLSQKAVSQQWEALDTDSKPIFSFLTGKRKIGHPAIETALANDSIRFFSHPNGGINVCFAYRNPADMSIRTYQKVIVGNGSKIFLKGAKVQGLFFSGADLHESKRVIIAEKPIDALSAAEIMPDACCIGLGGTPHTGCLNDLAPHLNGQEVILAFDNDDAGAKASKIATRIIPHAKSIQWDEKHHDKYDINDLLKDAGFPEFERMVRNAKSIEIDEQKAEENSRPPFPNLMEWVSTDRFYGEPPPRKYLVGGKIPMGMVTLLAAAGGVGKSFLLLFLARLVATFKESHGLIPQKALGGPIESHGWVIVVTGEDDAIEVHNRLYALGGPVERLIVVPMPSNGGAEPFFKQDPRNREQMTTAAWDGLVTQLLNFEHKIACIMIDPLQIFCALDLNAPENGQAIFRKLPALAEKTGAAVIICHHFRKTPAFDPDSAREAIRGTTGIVDGVRSVYALWEASGGKNSKNNPKTICKRLGEKYEKGKIIQGGIVKANVKVDWDIATYCRSEKGILIDITQRIRSMNAEPDDLKPLLVEAIKAAAECGKPYTKTGTKNGVYERRFEMHYALHSMSKKKLPEMIDDLERSGQIVKASAQGQKVVQWLDIPNGPFANGIGTFTAGKMERCEDAETEDGFN